MEKKTIYLLINIQKGTKEAIRCFPSNQVGVKCGASINISKHFWMSPEATYKNNVYLNTDDDGTNMLQTIKAYL